MHQRKSHLRNRRGTAILEAAFLLPVLVVILLIMVDLCTLLDEQLSLTHLSREAAGVLSRGAEFTEVFDAIKAADGHLDLDGTNGQVILTRVGYDEDGDPIIVAQETMGGLGHQSSVGSSPADPASIPNGRTVPGNMPLVIVEVYTKQPHFLGNLSLENYSGDGDILLSSRAAF
jgi:hypothetical protein